MKGKYYICVRSYEWEGTHHQRGEIHYHTSTRPILNPDWQIATLEELNDYRKREGLKPKKSL